VVYDPLHRQYVQIPPIPADLTAFAVPSGCVPGSLPLGIYHEPFLAPAGWEEESSLRVFCNVLSKTKIVTFVFSSVTLQWQAIASFGIVQSHGWVRLMRFPSFMKRHCTHGCFYWTEYSEEAMLVLDTLEMKFSIVGLPPGNFRRYNHTKALWRPLKAGLVC
jgi:hypothetical protein